MDPMKKTLILLVAIAAVGTVYLYRERIPQSPRQEATSGIPTTSSDQDAPSSREVASTPPQPISQVLSLAGKFNSTADLRAFADSLRERAKAGDAEATYYISRTLDYCRDYSLNPAGYQRDTDNLQSSTNVASSYKTVRERVMSRCRGYTTPNSRITRPDIIGTLQTAAKQGSLAAEATLFTHGEPVSTDQHYVSDLVNRVMESRNPDAYLAISDAMGTRLSGSEGSMGNIAGSPNAPLAWQLAACRLGLDCSGTGALVTQYCANGGVCGNFQNLEGLIYNGLVSQSDAKLIDGMVAEILTRR
jgi:hypothetical protein